MPRSSNTTLKRFVDDDLAVVTRTVSLIDPISLKKIEFPVKFDDCTHLACYDLTSYINMIGVKALQALKWPCPICKGKFSQFDLRKDLWFSEALRSASPSSTEV